MGEMFSFNLSSSHLVYSHPSGSAELLEVEVDQLLTLEMTEKAQEVFQRDPQRLSEFGDGAGSIESTESGEEGRA